MCATISLLRNNVQHGDSEGNFVISIQSHSKTVAGTYGCVNSCFINPKLNKTIRALSCKVMNRRPIYFLAA